MMMVKVSSKTILEYGLGVRVRIRPCQGHGIDMLMYVGPYWGIMSMRTMCMRLKRVS